MKRTLWLAALAATLAVAPLAAQEPADYVNPFIGTTNFGTTNPGAVCPNGLMSVAPFNVMGSDMNRYDKDARWWSTPYEYYNKFFTGFSHVNLSGVGCPEMGSLLLMATSGPLDVDYHNYGSTYSRETASPGYYSNFLDKYGILAEVSATLRSGVTRFTFPAGESHILLNLGEGLTNESGAFVRRVSDTEIEGTKLLGTFCYNPQAVFPIYFVMRVNKRPEAVGYWKMQPPKQGVEAEWDKDSGRYKLYTRYAKELAGDDIGVWFTYRTTEGEQIEVQMGVSFVSMENARMNLDAEQQGKDFDAVRAEARARWNDDLGRIRVEGGTREQREVFYTGLYHALIHPNLLQDVNGEYPVMESSEIRTVKGNRYTVFSLWDTYRNVHQLLTLVYPERQIEMVRSMVDIYKEWGWMPKWELYGRETFTMEGDPAIPVIVDTWMKGLRDFDVESAYEAFLKSATTPGAENRLRPDIDPYIERGYVPLGFYAKDLAGDASVSHALEYYIADYALSRLADSLGRKEDARLFRERSLGYRHYYDKEYGTLRPITLEGRFLTPFDPKAGENFTAAPGFHEGSAWNYTFLRAARRRGAGATDGRQAQVRRQAPDGLRHGPLRPGQRARHRLSLPLQLLQGRGVAYAARGAPSDGEVLHHRARRHPRQRRYGNNVDVGCLLDDGPLSRLSGRALLYAHLARLRQGDHPPRPALLRARRAGHPDARQRSRQHLHPLDVAGRQTASQVPHQPRGAAAGRYADLRPQQRAPLRLFL